jgi:hypothetical protein
MISFNASPPPAMPSDAALLGAIALLAALGNAGNTTALLNEIAGYKQQIERATAEAKAAHKGAEDAAAKLTGLQDQARTLAEQEAALAARQTALNVASEAVAQRDRALDGRVAELQQREQRLGAAEKAHADRIAAFRQALSA